MPLLLGFGGAEPSLNQRGAPVDHEVRHGRRPWVVIVEPDETAQLLVVITVYPVEIE